jgi:uncharacterized protein YcfJ
LQPLQSTFPDGLGLGTSLGAAVGMWIGSRFGAEVGRLVDFRVGYSLGLGDGARVSVEVGDLRVLCRVTGPGLRWGSR